MKIFLNQEKVNEIPYIIWRDGSHFLSILWGVHYTNQGAEGIYRVIVNSWRTPGRRYVEIFNYRVILMKHWPFIFIERFPGIEVGL